MKTAYEIKNVELILDQTYSILDDRIIQLSIADNYITQRLPLIRLDLMLSGDMVVKFFKNRDKAILNMEIHELDIDSLTEDLVNRRLYYKGSMKCIPVDDESNFRLIENIDAPDPDRLDQFISFSMYLVNSSDILFFDKEHSITLRNVSKADALKSIFKLKDIPKNVVLATPPDSSIEESIIIPQGNLISNIEYLDKMYGLYDGRIILYKDLFNLYCINSYYPNISIQRTLDFNDVVFTLLNDTDPGRLINSFVDDVESKTHTVNLVTVPIISNYTNTSSDTEFSTIMTVDSNGNINKTSTGDNTKLKFIYSYNNIDINKQINTNINNNKLIKFDISDMPIRIFKPYKEYTFTLPNELELIYDVRKDKYSIESVISVLSKNGSRFNVATALSFTKINR